MLWQIKQTLYKLGMERAAAERRSDLLNPSAAGRTICWMAMQRQMLGGGALPGAPQHPSSAWGEVGSRRSQTPPRPRELMFWTSA